MPLHVPTVQEIEALYRAHANALRRWEHVLKVEETLPEHPPTTPEEFAVMQRDDVWQLRVWLAAYSVERHRRAVLVMSARRYLAAMRLRKLFVEGKLN